MRHFKAEHSRAFSEFDLCYGLTETRMRSLGLYVSEPLSEAETTGLFAEPGAFGIRPDGAFMLVEDVIVLIDGSKFAPKKLGPYKTNTENSN